MRALMYSLAACTVLGACTTSPHLGRSQLTVPQQLSEVYSEVDMRLTLVTSPNSRFRCAESECDAMQEFDFRVARLGQRLAVTAFDSYPELRDRIRKFEFVVADKTEPGTTSNAGGMVVILRGTNMLDLSDEALAFVIAREMGHVIANHHNENTATSFMASVVATILMPVSSIFRVFSLLPGASSAAAASATTATATTTATAAASAAATAASFVGSKVVMASYWPQQLQEGDLIALHLAARLDYAPQDIADGLERTEEILGRDGWAKDLRISSENIAEIAQGPRLDKDGPARLAGRKPFNLTYVAGQAPEEDSREDVKDAHVD